MAKKKGPTCYRCEKPGHCLNDCEVVLCDCCQRSVHATVEYPLIIEGTATEVSSVWFGS
jgi:hypothetical protein